MRCHSNKNKSIFHHTYILYLLKMTELKEYHPHVYKKFMEGSRYQKNWQRYSQGQRCWASYHWFYVGKSIYELSFEWKRQDITLAPRTSVIINNEQVQVDPQLMFQRLRAIATRETNENPTSLFKYELCLVWHIISSKGRQQACPCRCNLELVKHEKIVLPANVSCIGCL